MVGMGRARLEGLNLGAVSLGWVVAIISGTVFGGILSLIAGAFGESQSLLPTLAAAGGSLVSGFLAYLVGGFCAARSAGTSGGLNGAMIAVLALIMGLLPSVAFTIFSGLSGMALAVPQMSFRTAGGSLLAALILFLVNLVGGYVGGRLGEPALARRPTRGQPSPATFEGQR